MKKLMCGQYFTAAVFKKPSALDSCERRSQAASTETLERNDSEQWCRQPVHKENREILS